VRGENQSLRDQLLRAKLENSQLAAQIHSPPLSPDKVRRAPPPPRSPRAAEEGEASRVSRRSSKSQQRSSKSQQRALAAHPPPPAPPPGAPHPASDKPSAEANEERPMESESESGTYAVAQTEKRRSRSKSASRGPMPPPPMPPPPPPGGPRDHGASRGDSSVDLLATSNAFAPPSKPLEPAKRGPSPLSRSSRPRDAAATPLSPGPRVRSGLRASSRSPRGSEAEFADVADPELSQEPSRGRDVVPKRLGVPPRPPSPVSARKRPSSKEPMAAAAVATSPRSSRMLQSSLGSPGGVASALSPGPRRTRTLPAESNGAEVKDLLSPRAAHPSPARPSSRPSSRPSPGPSNGASPRGQSAEPNADCKASPEVVPRRGASASPRSKPSALTSELLRTSPLFRPASPVSSQGGDKDDGSLRSASENLAGDEDRNLLMGSASSNAAKGVSTWPRNGVPRPSKLQARQVATQQSTPSFSAADLEVSAEPSHAVRAPATQCHSIA
jgi:hypothetical protein